MVLSSGKDWRDRILHPKKRDRAKRTPQADRTPSLSLALSLFLPSLETPNELIPPQSISSGKSSIDIPACSRSSFNRRI
ncbi:MAG: hypothetical protein ACLFWI_28885 [Coleofasciculus sp.]|uniref:hypothetical protein n=1 Tax=Coleofasciculus sp. TaxID=3100458 RepID=UPI003A180876